MVERLEPRHRQEREEGEYERAGDERPTAIPCQQGDGGQVPSNQNEGSPKAGNEQDVKAGLPDCRLNWNPRPAGGQAISQERHPNSHPISELLGLVVAETFRQQRAPKQEVAAE